MTLAEAAKFLRMSRSSLYQRNDIPRYRLPGSRTWLYDQDELEVLLKGQTDVDAKAPEAEAHVVEPATGNHVVLEISSERVYHRSARYR